MAIRKSELYSSIWASCDELRGGMDASQYKDYVLVLLFVKYVSDKYAGQKNPLIVVPEGGSFANMVALKGKVDIGDKMNKIISRLAEANELKGVIDIADFNDAEKLGKGKEMQDRLSNLVAIFETSLDFSKNRAEGDDLLGDAYEYLMRNFATESGKSKGQFYTPAEVSRVMAKVIGIRSARSADTTIHDPTCGSGSLLLKAADEAAEASGVKITIYGQEMDNATRALARMNMILHDNPTAEIWQGNTLAEPHYKAASGALKTFDFVVANPPFSTKAWSSGLDPVHDPYERFVDGIPPAKNGDYAFLLHILRAMKSTGKGAVILPHGVLFRGNAEGEIRKNLVRKGYIKGIIGLPANLFYGTGIPACILVLDKENAAARTGIFMINASQGFMKDGNKNRLRHQDIHKIVDVFTRQLELPRYSHLVPLAEIEANDYNLNIPRYIDNSEEEDIQDITAHLNGGIPKRDLDALNVYWQVFPSLRADLFAPAERPGYSLSRVEAAQVKTAIFNHPEFSAFQATVTALFEQWQAQNKPRLMGLKQGSAPKALIEALSESLLATFAEAPLLDKYDLYQRLMTYWTDVMQDDVYLIASDGWLEASKPRQMAEDRKSKEKPDLEIGKVKLKADLIPPALIVARYFAADQRALDDLKAEQEGIAQQLDEMKEEHGGEEGLLADAQDEKGNITKSTVMERLKMIRRVADPDTAEERRLLEVYQALIEKEANAGRRVKDAQKALDETVINQYGLLSEEEVKVLVVDDKWLATLNVAVTNEMERVSQVLTGRIKELTEHYNIPLPQIIREVETLSAMVDGHLQMMGLTWN
jgi:type I restriction enzyme M protein